MATIQGIYVALFGRPADPLGLNYFNEATGNGANLDAIGDLASTDEYQDRFDGLTNNEIITQIYQDLFGRDPEAAGLEFFVAALNNGTLNINNIAIAILDGAQGDDAAVVANKVAAADAFTAALDTELEIGAYKGDAAAEIARNLLSGITADEDTIPDADAIAAAVAEILTRTTAGETYELDDAAANEIVAGNKNDIFDGSVLDSWKDGDTLDGGLGLDTLNATLATDVAPLEGEVKNIEIFNLTADGAAVTVDFAEIEGAQQVWNVESADDLDIINLAEGIEIGVRGDLDGSTATFAFDEAEAASLTLEDAVNAAVEVTGAEALTVTIDGDTVASITSDADEVSFAGEGNVDLVLDLVNVELIDLSAIDGTLIVDIVQAAEDAVVIGTTGADFIGLYSADGLILTYSADEQSIYAVHETVDGFTSGTDFIDVSAFDLAKEAVVNFSVLVDGSAYVNASIGLFEDGADTYVFFDTNNNGKIDLASDTAILLTGVTGLTAADFVF